MGLGKTLQTLILIATSHYKDNKEKYPSLVVCPPTIVPQWEYEISKFFLSNDLQSLSYLGSLNQRKLCSKKIGKMKNQVVLCSYNIIIRDLSIFQKYRWDYCVLDEGHIIKNPDSKKTLALKSLFCKHRLILSGTPIQNNVQELWR